MEAMYSLLCTVDGQNSAECACLCVFPLPLLCTEHTSKHSGSPHLLLPLEITASVTSISQYHRYRKWLFHLTTNVEALNYRKKDLEKLEEQVEAAYLEVSGEVNRQHEVLIQGIRSANAAFSETLQTATQTVWAHALDLTWEPTTSLAEALWTKEAEELSTWQLYRFSVWARSDLVKQALGAQLDFEGLKELKGCDFGGLERLDTPRVRKSIKSELAVEELRRVRKQVKGLEAAITHIQGQSNAQSACVKAAEAKNAEFERKIAALESENAKLVEKLTEKITTNRWFEDIEGDFKAKYEAMEGELAVVTADLAEKKKENERISECLQGYDDLITDLKAEYEQKIADLQEKIEKLQLTEPKLPPHCVPYPKPLPKGAFSSPLCIEAVTTHPALQLPNGDVYVGQWNQQGQRHGLGRCYSFAGGIFEGVWVHDQQTYWMRALLKGGSVYVGEVQQGLKEGVGMLRCENGNMFVGEWSCDKRQGSGVLQCSTREVDYFGEWNSGKMHGKGVLFSSAGWFYAGKFQRGERGGEGIEQHRDGSLIAGNFSHDKPQGPCKQLSASGKAEIGTWQDGAFLPSIDYSSSQLYKSFANAELVESQLGAQGTKMLRTVAVRWSDFHLELVEMLLQIVLECWARGEREVFKALREAGYHFQN